MDHLPPIYDAIAPSDEVQCTISESWQYDKSGLAEFPLRAGLAFRKGIGKIL